MRPVLLVLDVDGVVLHDKDELGRHWSADIEHDLGVDRERLWDDLFRPYWPDIATGKLELSEAASRALNRQAAPCCAEEFLAYWFQRASRINASLLELVRSWRRQTSAPAFLATNQEARRARHLWDVLALRECFSDIVFSGGLGAMKPTQAFYSRALEQIGADRPEQILFFDDTAANVEAARAAGWTAFQFRDVAHVEGILMGGL